MLYNINIELCLTYLDKLVLNIILKKGGNNSSLSNHTAVTKLKPSMDCNKTAFNILKCPVICNTLPGMFSKGATLKTYFCIL